MSSEVEVHSLRCGSVPSAVTGCERDPYNSTAVPCGQPALLIVTLPAHRFLLLALGHPALPGQAQDVGVAAEDWAMLHGGEHSCSSLRPSVEENNLQGLYECLSSAEVSVSVLGVRQRQLCIVLALSLVNLGDL